jgi:nucleoside-diphosphate-sugar epimerase
LRSSKATLADEERLPGWLQGHDVVIHLAALVPVTPSVSRPVAYAQNNVVTQYVC